MGELSVDSLQKDPGLFSIHTEQGIGKIQHIFITKHTHVPTSYLAN